MPREGFEPAIPASDQLQILALDRSAIGVGYLSGCPSPLTAGTRAESPSTRLQEISFCPKIQKD